MKRHDTRVRGGMCGGEDPVLRPASVGSPCVLYKRFKPESNQIKSNQIGRVHEHLVDLRRIILFDIPERAHVLRLDEIDGDALASCRPERPIL